MARGARHVSAQRHDRRRRERHVLRGRVAVRDLNVVLDVRPVAERRVGDVVGTDGEPDGVVPVRVGRDAAERRVYLGARDRVVVAGVCDLAGKRPVRAGDAVRELEAPDPGLPVERARARVVLVRVPERAVVAGVDRDVRIVAPAAERVGLAAGSGEEGGLTLRQRVQRIAGQPSRIADLRVDAGGRGAEADGDVTQGVHRCASHPPPRGVRLVGALLHEAGRA